MSATIIDGKAIANDLCNGFAKKVEAFKKDKNHTPTLAIIVVGRVEASLIYVNNKIRKCQEVGIHVVVRYLDSSISQIDLERELAHLNCDDFIDAILVQLPLPHHINTMTLFSRMVAWKDVDGFSVENVGKLILGYPNVFTPCTALGVMKLIESTKIDLTHKEAVIIGRSQIVGKPVATLLLAKNCTTVICHSYTWDISAFTETADIVVSAVGKKDLIRGYMIKKGALVIDVGINYFENKIYGDVNFEEVSEVADFITPVPGGVGPMTVAMLIHNILIAAEKNFHWRELRETPN